MQTKTGASNRSHSGIGRSLRTLAAAVCLWPAVAAAQPPDPTNSDSNANTAAGTNALFNVTGGYGNTAVGDDALLTDTSGSYNTATGYYALNQNNSGAFNTATGTGALDNNVNGSYNTASGGYALLQNTTGSINTASGYEALYANTTGGYNTATGAYALIANTTGQGNVAVGYNALTVLSGGSNNIALGTNAGVNVKTGTGNIEIGAGGGTNDSHIIRIGSNQTKTVIAGIKGVPLSGATVVVNSAGQLGVVASSARYKKDIKPLADTAKKLAQLRPVSFRYKTEPDATHYGLIAEEVDKVMPELVVRNEENRPDSVRYEELIPLLLQQWKAQQARLAREEEENARQRTVIERQETEIAGLRQMLATRLAAFDRTAHVIGDK